MEQLFDVAVLTETASGFKSANIVHSGHPLIVEGWPETYRFSSLVHKKAVSKLLTLNKDFKEYNLSIDPNYIPRTKR